MTFQENILNKIKACRLLNSDIFTDYVPEKCRGGNIINMIYLCFYNEKNELEWPKDWDINNRCQELKPLFNFFKQLHKHNNKRILPFSSYSTFYSSILLLSPAEERGVVYYL